MITKFDSKSIDYTLLNSSDSCLVMIMFFKLFGMEVLSLINNEFKESLTEDEEVTMKVVVELDKRKVQG